MIPLDSILISAKSICKIKVPFHRGSGFLIKLSDFFCLITNEHVVTKNLIKQKDTIMVYYDKEKKFIKIKLDPNERIIREFTYIDIDATVIEILPEDNIDQKFFLLPLDEYMNDFEQLSLKDIAIIQYPNGKLCMSFGKITNISNFTFSHSTSTQDGSSGSPIFLKNTTKVIGIHKSYNGNVDEPENYGNFIGPIFKYFKDFPYKRALNRSFKANNNGDFMKISVEGKGKIYKNGNIKYDGNFVKTFKEGKGIEYYENGNKLYEGYYKLGKWDGKGIKYYINGNKAYEEEYKDGFPNGKGIGYYENGNKLHEGEYKDDFANGKGIEYYENGNKLYKGYYKLGKRDWKGIHYYGNKACEEYYKLGKLI